MKRNVKSIVTECDKMTVERNVAICDDDLSVLERFTQTCNLYYKGKMINAFIDNFSTGEALLSTNKKYDYILLDIEMEDLNGIEVAEEIRKTDIDTMIVIISGYQKYKNRAYSAHVFDYLDKPVNSEKLINLLDELERYMLKKIKKEYVTFKTIDGVVRLDVDDIVYFEYYERKVNIHTFDETYYLYGNISDIAKQMDEYGFIYPHRAYVVNMKYIEKIEGNSIILYPRKGNVPISKLKKKEIRETFFNFLTVQAEIK